MAAMENGEWGNENRKNIDSVSSPHLELNGMGSNLGLDMLQVRE